MDKNPDFASLLAAGERATFHGPPASAVATLEQAVEIGRREGRLAEVSAASWLLGVALEAGGRYGGALGVLLPLVDAADSDAADAAAAETRLFAALAAAAAASVHRGLGRHAAAAELDNRGFALTEGPGEAAFDCALGLTADAVGGGDLDAARSWLARSEAIIEGRGGEWWRQRVGLDWVRAEVALLADEPHDAILAAAGAVSGAEAARAPRHVAKGLLYQGVAEVQAGSAVGVATLRRAASLAENLGAVPLIWQARALVGALLGGEESEEGRRSLAAARSAVLSIANDLPEDLCNGWLARPNVSAVLEA